MDRLKCKAYVSEYKNIFRVARIDFDYETILIENEFENYEELEKFQYTLLLPSLHRDTKGNMIYDGDVIKGQYETYVVWYSPETDEFMIQESSSKSSVHMDNIFDVEENFEIIGNIYVKDSIQYSKLDEDETEYIKEY